MAMKSILGGAFAWNRLEASAAQPAAVGAEEAPAKGSGSDVTASWAARLVTFLLLVAGVLIAWRVKEDGSKAFKPAEGFVLLTGFYVAAQAIERVLELLPGGSGTKQSKANRAVIFAGLGFVIAVIVAEQLHLYFISAVGTGDVDLNLDVIITALAIGGGTKPLHDAIKGIEKAKETPPATT